MRESRGVPAVGGGTWQRKAQPCTRMQAAQLCCSNGPLQTAQFHLPGPRMQLHRQGPTPLVPDLTWKQ